MDRHLPLLVPATADCVLAIFRDQHRHAAALDPDVDAAADLTATTTVAAWRAACNLLPARRLATALNAGFGIAVSPVEWAAALSPPKLRTLGGVCDLIARHATLPAVRPTYLLGRPCAPAGAFLTVRQYLAVAGADVRPLAPSTSVAEYARQYPDVFLRDVGRLAPGALPTVGYEPTACQRVVAAVGVLATVAGVVLCAASPPLRAVSIGFRVAAGVPVGLAALAVVSGIFQRLWPVRVGFGGVRTFRDLAVRVAAAS